MVKVDVRLQRLVYVWKEAVITVPADRPYSEDDLKAALPDEDDLEWEKVEEEHIYTRIEDWSEFEEREEED